MVVDVVVVVVVVLVRVPNAVTPVVVMLRLSLNWIIDTIIY